MALEKFNWQNGTQTEPAKVEIDGTSYDVVDAQFEGETPLSAANLNLMQDTILGNVVDTLTDDTKIPSVKAVKGKILWENTSPTSSFSGKTVNLTNSGVDYDIYKVFYKQTSSTDFVESIEFIKGHGSFIEIADIVNRVSACSRIITSSSDTQVVFEDCKKTTGTVENMALIPIYIVGIKTGLF